jgi:ribonuclease P protein component
VPQDRPGGFGFPKTRRLRRRREFLELQGGRARRERERRDESRAVGVRRRRAGRFVVFVRPRAPGEPGRLGVTASSRVGCAVRRNRIRRLIREAFRTATDLFPEGHDVVVLVTTGEGEWTLRGVREELARWKQPRPQVDPSTDRPR